jgi:hypothetical protein
MALDVCKSCGAQIIWALSRASGCAMPIDRKARPDGNVALSGGGPTPVAEVLRGDDLKALRDAGAAHTSHHYTCPDGAAWRRRKGNR